jgi:hypothetical protein
MAESGDYTSASADSKAAVANPLLWRAPEFC